MTDRRVPYHGTPRGVKGLMVLMVAATALCWISIILHWFGPRSPARARATAAQPATQPTTQPDTRPVVHVYIVPQRQYAPAGVPVESLAPEATMPGRRMNYTAGGRDPRWQPTTAPESERLCEKEYD